MGQEKYNHLVPATYLKSWCVNNDSIYTKDNLNNIKILNRYNSFGINDYYSIKAGMCCCRDEDLEKIFDPVKGLHVIYEENELMSNKLYNEKYYDFNNWIILDEKNNQLTKKQINVLKQKIDKIKIVDIEKLWNIKYEDKWDDIKLTITQRLDDLKTNAIEPFEKEFLMKWIILLDWRGFQSNNEFNNIFNFIDKFIPLSKIDIEYKDRVIPKCDNAIKEMKRELLLSNFREFLSEYGKMYERAKGYIKYTTIRFLKSDNIPFITSDNPSFEYRSSKCVTHIMPVTPKLLITVVKGNIDSCYYVNQLADKEVKQINKIIKDNSEKYIISNRENFNELF